ncbi:hypothetical protein HK096_002878 [Nowakowskiella sp. JEL0078]|nr:hypothetical protein HK096_002878 [Nowakowskiella sp. JEL0078]
MAKVVLDLWVGSHEVFLEQENAFNRICQYLAHNAKNFGFSTNIEELTIEEKEMLVELYNEDKAWSGPCRVLPPQQLSIGEISIDVFVDKCPKTSENFISLCSGKLGNSKKAPYKPLHYKGCRIHRIVSDFIAQGGDITRDDGTGGESIYGGRFNDEKEGLKLKFKLGTIAMANSGKNSNTSQFFIVLTDDKKKLEKLDGKYVVFGQLIDGFDVLKKLNELGSESGNPITDVIIGNCQIKEKFKKKFTARRFY